MSERVTMPALGESVTEGTVTRWLKNIGDTVEVDEPLLEVSTDKVDTEIPSPVAGTLQEILAEEDETVPVGADLAVIGEGETSGGSGGAEGGGGPGDEAGADDASAREPGQPEPEAPSTEQPVAEQTSEPEASQSQPSGGGEQQTSGGGEQQTSGGGEQQASGGGEQQASGGSGSSGGRTVTMPALGESVTEGTVTRWLKAEGDTVEVDEPLLEVSTDKVDTEIPSPVAGVVSTILVQEDEVVPVGADLAVIGGEAGGGEAGADGAAGEAGGGEDQPSA
ncbi:MAG: biotin/lipoyl-containing protein, partial [Lapillicoccus sp.]